MTTLDFDGQCKGVPRSLRHLPRKVVRSAGEVESMRTEPGWGLDCPLSDVFLVNPT